MPPKNTKQTKGNAAKKEQIAEKVKEIQLRQKNWMQQRDQHLKKGAEVTDTIDVPSEGQQSKTVPKNFDRKASNGRTSNGADILKIEHDSSQHLASQVSDKLNVKVKHGFGAWLQSRKHADESEDHDRSEAVYNQEKYSGAQQYSRNFQEETSSVSASTAISSIQSSHRSYPLSPAEFDSLADSIAARVKKDLGIRNSNSANLNNKYYDRAEPGEEGPKRGKTSAQEMPEMEHHADSAVGDSSVTYEDGVSVDVSSHRCPFCSSLMVASAHIPMLLVPCGHTVCKRCSTSHTCCRLCGTRVGSLTTNIMLQQIIQEFHRKSHPGSSGSHQSTAGTTWERQGVLPSLPPKTTAKHCSINYSAQLQSLQDREAALQEEAASCRKDRDHISSKVNRAEKQLKAIQREEESLEEKIHHLQDKLQALQQHKEEYVGEYQQLQEELKTASDQVMLVERTLESLGEEIDKVQFLAEGQEDVYQQRQLRQR